MRIRKSLIYNLVCSTYRDRSLGKTIFVNLDGGAAVYPT